MANHSSAEKSIRKIAKRAAVNRNRRTRVRTYIKKVVTAAEGEVNGIDARSALVRAQSEMMRAVAKGLIKKNTASRKISRLAKKIKLAASAEKTIPKAEKIKVKSAEKNKDKVVKNLD